MFFYQAAYYVTRHLHWPKLRDIVGDRSLYTCGIFFFVGLYLVCGIFNANGLNAVYYQLSVPSQQASENGMRVAIVSDLHIGGGADSTQIDHVVSMLNNIEVYISFLRKKIHAIDAPVQIKTARGIGYFLEKTT